MGAKAERMEAISRMRGEGKSVREIAEALHCGKTTVSRYIQVFGIGVPHCPHCGVALRVTPGREWVRDVASKGTKAA